MHWQILKHFLKYKKIWKRLEMILGLYSGFADTQKLTIVGTMLRHWTDGEILKLTFQYMNE